MDYKVVDNLPSYKNLFILQDNDVSTSIIYSEELKSKFGILRKMDPLNQNEEAIKKFRREIELLISLNHSLFNKVLYYGSKNDFLILELLPQGDIEEYLEYLKFKIPDFDEEILFRIIYQISLSIQILHNNNIIHRDIKPENIFVGENNRIVLGDFGLSRFENPTKSCNPGTVGYVAPEIINNDPYSFPSDIYSLGCTIFYILFLKRPYHFEKSENRTLSLAKKKNLIQFYEEYNINDDTIEFKNEFNELKENNSFYFNLFKRCIELKPEDRPNINEIINDLNLYGENKFGDDFEKLINLNEEIGNINISGSSFSYFCRSLYQFEILNNNSDGIIELQEALNLNSYYGKKYYKILIRNKIISENDIKINSLNDNLNNKTHQSMKEVI